MLIHLKSQESHIKFEILNRVSKASLGRKCLGLDGVVLDLLASTTHRSDWTSYPTVCLKILVFFFTLHQCIFKLTPLQPLLVVSPGWCRHAAVGVQQDPEAPDQQEDQEKHEEADEGQGSTLLGVHPHQGQRGGDAAATTRTAWERRAGWGQQQLVVNRGHIVHPPLGPEAGLTHWLDSWGVGRSGRKGGECGHGGQHRLSSWTGEEGQGGSEV